MNFRTYIFLVIMLILSFASAVNADQGDINGTITIQNAALTRIVAVDRAWADIQKVTKNQKDEYVYEGTIKPKTGKFLIAGLLPGHSYDLIVWSQSADGTTTRWDGVNMGYHRAIRPDKPLTPEDKAWLNEFITQTPQFYDKCRILWMAADHGHATLLVELSRLRDFYHDKGDVVYRIELWYFENLFGGWAKDRNTEKVMARWRGPYQQIEQNWQWVPALGGISIKADGTSEPVNATLPDKLDPRRGIVGGRWTDTDKK